MVGGGRQFVALDVPGAVALAVVDRDGTGSLGRANTAAAQVHTVDVVGVVDPGAVGAIDIKVLEVVVVEENAVGAKGAIIGRHRRVAATNSRTEGTTTDRLLIHVEDVGSRVTGVDNIQRVIGTRLGIQVDGTDHAVGRAGSVGNVDRVDTVAGIQLGFKQVRRGRIDVVGIAVAAAVDLQSTGVQRGVIERPVGDHPAGATGSGDAADRGAGDGDGFGRAVGGSGVGDDQFVITTTATSSGDQVVTVGQHGAENIVDRVAAVEDVQLVITTATDHHAGRPRGGEA